VTRGPGRHRKVITAAATIMILVFASFALGPSIIIKQFASAWPGAIIIDAFIIRTALVPRPHAPHRQRQLVASPLLDRLIPAPQRRRRTPRTRTRTRARQTAHGRRHRAGITRLTDPGGSP